jgi:hypothetical protein
MMMENQTSQSIISKLQYVVGNPFIEPMKKSIKIKDNRAKFF